ncbi:hypothetical protein EH223_20540 [candidate division KSB1 bacterium]|nr:hypothetical protein [candidate division KSB1 bacterium]RQV99892.1 MAG: hypothetical protein EH223_20540 [candidate division KSB1 bacterium]
MRHIYLTLVFIASVSTIVGAVAVQGTLITQIKGITENVTIRASSNPDVLRRPGADGTYTIPTSSLAQDYILVAPEAGDDNLYSPRIIKANAIGTDTLYIIPPTNQTVTIIVDNKTNREFSFLADKCIILNEMVTSEKDYELEVIPHRSPTPTLLIAGISAGYPAVVKSVNIDPVQLRGYLEIEPQDIGLPPARAEQTRQRATPLPPLPVDDESRVYERAPRQIEEQIRSSSEAAVTPSKPPSEEVKSSESFQSYSMTPSRPHSEQMQREVKERSIEKMQAAYYFSDRFVLKDRENSSLAVRGTYDYFPNTSETTQIFHYGLDLYNIKILKKYFDLSLSTSNWDQIDDMYYRGSLTWHHSPYASIDVAYKSAQNSTWYQQYDVAQTSVGVNGYYKSRSTVFQFGVGVRFQVDYGDFNVYFTDVVEKKYRYLQSIYLLGSTSIGQTTASFMAGLINEAAYASVSVLLFRHVGINYTFKNVSGDNTNFTPLEKELAHKISLYVNFTLKNRNVKTGQLQ